MRDRSLPAPGVTQPRAVVPVGACDCHSHVFGPLGQFPLRRPSVYALPEAYPAVHAQVRRTLGMSRGVLTQPAPYADDPAAMLAAIAGSRGRLRGVAVATPDIADTTLSRWRDAGVVGLRFVEMRASDGDRYPGSVGFDAIEVLAPLMRALGLHAQLWASAHDFRLWLPRLTRLGVPLVLDHMGSPATERGVDCPDFAAVIDSLASDLVWVKLVLARVADPHCDDARPFHDRLIGAAPMRMLWGSDWPYVRMAPAPDAGAMLDRFMAWTPDAVTRRAILVDNPIALYGFEGDTA